MCKFDQIGIFVQNIQKNACCSKTIRTQRKTQQKRDKATKINELKKAKNILT